MTVINRNEKLLRDLSNSTVIVTGGANGIGASTARLFHHYGAKVVIADLPSTQASALSLISSLPESSRNRIAYIPTDILDWGSLTNLFKSTISKFSQVDIVIANAGRMESRPFFDENDVDENGDLREPSQSHQVIDLNLKGTMNSMSTHSCHTKSIEQLTPSLPAVRLAAHYMSRNPLSSPDSFRGSILLVCSTSGYFGSTSVISYVSSKHGVTGLLRSSRSPLLDKYRIRIDSVAPFMTPTHITNNFAEQWKKEGLQANSTEDVAWSIAQMASDDSMHGKCAMVVGGQMTEVEGPIENSMGDWIGSETLALFKKGAEFIQKLGGYRLPDEKRL